MKSGPKSRVHVLLTAVFLLFASDLGNHFLQKHGKQQFGTFGFIDTALTRKNLGEKGIKEMTAQVPAKRLGTPEEVASFVVW